MNVNRKKTILLVEDELLIAMTQKLFLEQYGYKVRTTHTGEQAIEILQKDSAVEFAIVPDSKKQPLEKIGYDVIVTNTAEKAVGIFLENDAIDLVLMDIDLGSGMDGTQAAEIILAHRKIPILFLSSHTEPDIVEKTEKITSYGYVVKNSSITVLDASIKMAFKLFEAYSKLSEELAERRKIDDRLVASETRYRRLFETTKDGILILDAESGMIVDVNPFLIKLLGFSHLDFMGKTIWDIGFLKDIVGNKEKFRELQENSYVRYENLPLETRGGKIIDVEFISNAYEVAGSRVIQCNIRDITDRKLADIKINALLDEKNLILREVHHRIKNSMNTIKSLCVLQANSLADPAAVSALKDMECRVQSMMVLYNKLYQSVSFTRILIKDYLSSLIDEIIRNFPYCETITVRKNIDDFIIDAKILQTLGIIINELLTNIMKYAFPGGRDGLIEITVTKTDDEVTVRVYDDGQGIPADVSFESTPGFGLMLVRTLTQQLGGSIRIERERGTTILLEFRV